MDALQIFLLGSPEVMWQGDALKINRRMSRALLFYLALEGRVSRNDLRALFWPDEEEEDKARANLRTALTRLRTSLPDPELLDVDSNTITLDRERVAVDAVRFLELAEPALRAAQLIANDEALPERVVQPLRQAAGLWRAPHFVSGFSFADDNPDLDHWQAATAQNFEGLYLRVLTRLADHFAAAGDLDSALRWVREALQADPLTEDLHIRALRWMLSLGQGAAAAAHAQALVERFEREDLDISGTLSALIRQVRQGVGMAALPEMLGWPAARLTRVALVGRAGQLQTLQTAFRRGGVMMMWGEAGVGKTRLAYELYHSLQPRPRLLLLNCLSDESVLPFQPLIDALRRVVRQEEWRRLRPAWLQQLAHLLPELAEGSSPELTGEGLRVELQRSHIFEALRHLLLEISRLGRLLVVLDGAQWCDEATLAALAYLNERRLFSERGLLLVTARSEERSPALERWSAAMRSVASIQLLNLPALTQAETADLAQRVLDQSVPEAVAARLAEETGGNPLFLLETLFALLENTPAAGLAGALAQLPVGGSLHHLLRQRLARLSLPARQVAAAAAVLHSEFTPAVLAEVAQLNLETVTRAVDDLLSAQLVQPVAGRPTAAYSFIYGQIREVIRWEQGIARLRLLHLRAARALAASENGSQRLAARLAYHYEQAGELLQAFHCWRQASQHARGLLAIDEALQAFEAAERLVPVLKELLSDETLYELYSTWGDTYIYDFTASLFKQQLFQRMLRLGEERHSPMLIGGALSARAYLISLQNQTTLALETFQQAAYQLEPLADALPAVQNDYRQGWYLMRLTRYSEAARLFEKGLARLEGVTSPAADEQRADLEFRLGMVYLLTGWPVKAHQLAERALRRTPSPGQVYGHLVMANAKYYLGQYAAALEHVRLGAQLAAAFTSQRMTGLFSITRLRIDLARGFLDAAWEQAHLAAEMGAAQHIPLVVSMALTLQGEIYRRLGAHQAAISVYQAGLAASRGPQESLNTRLHLGMALVDAGQVDEGLRQIETTCAEARQADLGEVFLPALTARAYLLARTHRLEEALEVLEELTPLAQERNFLPADVLSRMIMSLAAQQRGDTGEALRLMDAALHTTAGMVNPFWELRCYHLRTRLGPLGKQEAGRVQELLDLVANQAHDPELRPLAETFVNHNRTALLGLSQQNDNSL